MNSHYIWRPRVIRGGDNDHDSWWSFTVEKIGRALDIWQEEIPGWYYSASREGLSIFPRPVDHKRGSFVFPRIEYGLGDPDDEMARFRLVVSTADEPWDVVVRTALILLKEHDHRLYIRSDVSPTEWGDALGVANMVSVNDVLSPFEHQGLESPNFIRNPPGRFDRLETAVLR